MWIADGWRDYELLDAGGGEKLERWGKYVLQRPEPQAIWPKQHESLWKKAGAIYTRKDTGGGAWTYKNALPDRWNVGYNSFKFAVKAMGFKHTGIFPEQAVNWEWLTKKVSGRKHPRVLNLFAYTGCSTVALLAAGADVVHVDAARGMVEFAKHNASLSGLREASVRYIVDDVFQFVRREQRRKRAYDGIIMDPPSYGRGSNGQVWKLEECLYELASECAALMSDTPLFFLLNGYTTGFQAGTLKTILELTVSKRFGGRIEADELGLPINTGANLPSGASARWES